MSASYKPAWTTKSNSVKQTHRKTDREHKIKPPGFKAKNIQLLLHVTPTASTPSNTPTQEQVAAEEMNTKLQRDVLKFKVPKEDRRISKLQNEISHECCMSLQAAN